MKKMRILVVDDDPALGKLIKLLLERTRHCEVCLESRPLLAVRTAREFQPGVIFLDVNMPGRDGTEILRELREAPLLRETPVAFMTSLMGNEEMSVRQVNGEEAPFIGKGGCVAELLQRIDNILALYNPQIAPV